MELPLVHHTPYCQTEHLVLWYTNGDQCWPYRYDLAGQAVRSFDGPLFWNSGDYAGAAPRSTTCCPRRSGLSAWMRLLLLSQLPPRCHLARDKRRVWGSHQPWLVTSRPANKYYKWAGGILQVGCFDATSFGLDTLHGNFVYNFFSPLLPFFLDGKL